MNEAILQIVINGTNAAAAAGTITETEADNLRKEAVEAAAIDIQPEQFSTPND